MYEVEIICPFIDIPALFSPSRNSISTNQCKEGFVWVVAGGLDVGEDAVLIEEGWLRLAVAKDANSEASSPSYCSHSECTSLSLAIMSAPHCSPQVSRTHLSLIPSLHAQATQAESEGCFGAAEAFLHEAFRLAHAHFPDSLVHAQAAAALGVFQHRFIPYCEQPAAYLRLSRRIHTIIDPLSPESEQVSLQLAKSLIDTDNCREAEAILLEVLQTTQLEDTRIRANAYLGRICLVRGEVAKAEEMLRQTLAVARSVMQESEGEVLVCLGEVLVEKDRNEDGESALLEAAAIAARSGKGELLKQALRVLSSTYVKQNAISRMEDRVGKIVAQLKSDNSSQFLIADVLAIIGDALHFSGHEILSLPYYLEARSLTTSPGITWRSVFFHAKLHPGQYSNFTKVRLQTYFSMNIEWRRLPHSAAALLAVHEDYQRVGGKMKLATRVRLPALFGNRTFLEFINDSELHIEGELLLAFYRRNHRNSSQIQTFLAANPSCKAALRLKSELLANNKAADFTAKIEAMNWLVEAYKAADVSIESVADALTHLANLKSSCEVSEPDRSRLRAEALSHLREAVTLCCAMAPISYPAAATLQVLARRLQADGNYDEAETHFQHAISILDEINPESRHSLAAHKSLVRLFTQTQRFSEAENCLRDMIDTRKRINPASQYTAKAVHQLASFYVGRNRCCEADSVMQTQYELCLKSGPESRLAATKGLALLYIDMKRFSEAGNRLKEFADFCIEIGNEDLLATDALRQFSMLYRSLESHPAIEESISRVMEISLAKSVSVKLLHGIGNFLRKHNRQHAAETYFIRFIESCIAKVESPCISNYAGKYSTLFKAKTIEAAEALEELRLVYKSWRTVGMPQAEIYLKYVVQVYPGYSTPSQIIKFLFCFPMKHLKLGELTQAEESLTQLIDLCSKHQSFYVIQIQAIDNLCNVYRRFLSLHPESVTKTVLKFVGISLQYNNGLRAWETGFESLIRLVPEDSLPDVETNLISLLKPDVDVRGRETVFGCLFEMYQLTEDSQSVVRLIRCFFGFPNYMAPAIQQWKHTSSRAMGRWLGCSFSNSTFSKTIRAALEAALRDSECKISQSQILQVIAHYTQKTHSEGLERVLVKVVARKVARLFFERKLMLRNIRKCY